MADSYALEYPLNPEATLDPAVKPFDELEPPEIDPSTLNGAAGHRADDRGRPALTLLATPRAATRSPPGRAGPADPAHATAAAGRRAWRWRCSRWCRSGSSRPTPSSSARPRRGTCSSGPGSASCSGTRSRLAVGCMVASAGARRRAAPSSSSAPTCRLQDLWHGLLVAPLAVPAFVNSYALGVARPHASRGTAARCWSSRCPTTRSSTCRSSRCLRGLDPALEEAAWSLGPQPLARRSGAVVLPQLRPALLGGCLLVGLHLLAEFGALQLLRFPTFTTAIYDLYGSTFNGAGRQHDRRRAGALLPAAAARRAAAARPPALRPGRPRRRPARRAGRGSGRPRWPVAAAADRARRRSRSACRRTRLVHWLRVGSSTEFPRRRARRGRRHAPSALAPPGPRVTDAARAAGRLAGGAPPRRGDAPRSSAAPTSPTRCPASSWRSRSSRSASGWCRPSTRPRCCSSRRTPFCSCPARWSRVRAGARAGAGRPRRRRPQPRQPARSRPPAGSRCR